ncbi:MAG: DNA polymerase III subunit beta [Polyangia bacterium]
MELTLSKQCLTAALSRTASIADRKSSMQILSNVLISAQGPKQAQIAATDLNLSASGVFPAEVISGGAITLPAKTLYAIVRSMPDGPISINVDGENAEINAGRSNFKLIGLPADDFPRLPDTVDAEFFEIEAETVTKMIERTSFSMSSDETRSHLNGALFQGDGKMLRMVTTDGHRLSKVEFKTEESGFYNFSLIVPNKGIGEIRHLLEDGSGSVSIATQESSMLVRREIVVDRGEDGKDDETAEFLFVTKLIDAEFPPYDQVIPKGQDRIVTSDRAALLEALRRVSVVSSDRTLGIKFQLGSGSLEISSDNPSVGKGSEVVDVGYDGEELTIGFNARYFIDVLSVLEDDEIRLELAGSLDPAVVRDSSDSFVGVIMPMRV